MVWKHEVWEVSITVLTGLRIGGTEQEYEIGGIDNQVIKGIDGLPYIPGSSLKGKLRKVIVESVLPSKFSSEIERDNMCVNIFGSLCNLEASKNDVEKKNLQRDVYVIFRDLNLNEDKTREEIEEQLGPGFFERARDMKFVEVKTENKITLKNGMPHANPRVNERVIPYVVFSGDIVIKYRADKQALYEKVIEIIKEGVEYLSKYDYLGGNGTRGYGRVNIVLRKKEGV